MVQSSKAAPTFARDQSSMQVRETVIKLALTIIKSPASAGVHYQITTADESGRVTAESMSREIGC